MWSMGQSDPNLAWLGARGLAKYRWRMVYIMFNGLYSEDCNIMVGSSLRTCPSHHYYKFNVLPSYI